MIDTTGGYQPIGGDESEKDSLDSMFQRPEETSVEPSVANGAESRNGDAPGEGNGQ